MLKVCTLVTMDRIWNLHHLNINLILMQTQMMKTMMKIIQIAKNKQKPRHLTSRPLLD